MNNRALGMLSLAAKAGKVKSGEFSVEKLVKSKKAKLVIVARDASDNTKKLFTDKCKYYNVKIYIYAYKESLGCSIGKASRASVALEDANFSDTIEKLIRESN